MSMRAFLSTLPIAIAPALTQDEDLGPRSTHLPEHEVVVPLDLSSGHAIVRVVIDGRGPFPMILDTGASRTALDQDLAQELGLKVTGKTTAGDPSSPGAHTVDLVVLPSVALGAARFEEMTAVSRARPAALGSGTTRGVLGLPTFEDCLFTLDYEKSELRIARGELPSPQKSASPQTAVVAFHRRDSGLISVPLGLPGGVVLDAHLDSGNQSSVSVPSAYEPRLALADGSRRAESGVRAGGRVEFTSARLEGDLTIGPLVMRNPEIRFDSRMAHANLGLAFLQQAEVTVDLAHQRLRIRPYAADGILPSEGPTTEHTSQAGDGRSQRTLGIALDADAEAMTILSIVPGSLAEKAGIQAGDILLEVAGKPVSLQDTTALRAALDTSGPFEVVVDRGGARQSIQVPGEALPTPEPATGTHPEALFDRLIGSYEVVARTWPTPGADPIPFGGRATFERSHGGKHVHESFVLEADTGPIQGDAYLAWRPVIERFELTQIDSFSPVTFWLTGAWDETRARLAFRSAPDRPQQDGLRFEYRFEEGGGFVKEMLVPGSDGVPRLASEFHYIPKDR